MALSQNGAPPKFGGHTSFRNLPVAKNEWIHRGAAVGVDPAGYAKEFVAGDVFVGFAEHEFRADTTAGARNIAGAQTMASGYDTVRITAYADNVLLAVSNAARTDIGKFVYATDDGTFAYSGHPDAKIGRVIDLERSGYVVVEMRSPGVHVRNFNGVGVCESDFCESIEPVATFNSTYAQSALGIGNAGPFKLTSIGAGITTATGWASLDGEAGGAIRGLLDNDNEAQNLTCETATFMNQLKGMTFEMLGRLSVLGPTATTDFDFGLITAASSAVTAAIRANIDVTTAGIALAKCHVDGDSTNIGFTTDDDTTVLGTATTGTDTTLDNSLTVDKRFKIIVRPSGAVELWIDNVRYLESSASWSVGTTVTTLYAGFVNLEKSTGTDVSACVIDWLRVAGAS